MFPLPSPPPSAHRPPRKKKKKGSVAPSPRFSSLDQPPTHPPPRRTSDVGRRTSRVGRRTSDVGARKTARRSVPGAAPRARLSRFIRGGSIPAAACRKRKGRFFEKSQKTFDNLTLEKGHERPFSCFKRLWLQEQIHRTWPRRP